MLEAGLVFNSQIDRVIDVFRELPISTRPTHFSHEETIENKENRIEATKKFTDFLAKSQSGFFLLGHGLTYSIRLALGEPIVCDCFIEANAEDAIQFLEHMSKAEPIFGFVCDPAERERRNRITVHLGVNTIESWVGRDTKKYVPGFYWLTLLPDTLAKRHGVSISKIKSASHDFQDLTGGQHLFRFYQQPEDWTKTSATTNLCASLNGVFDIEKIRPKILMAKDFIALNSMLKEWK